MLTASHIMRETVTVHRAALTDGPRRERDWDNATSHVLDNCSVQPYSSSSNLDEREAYTESATLFAQPDADVADGDRIEYMGDIYAVVGIPMRVRSPRGTLDHTKVEIRRWS